MAPSNTLRLYEALELRAEYDARLKPLKDCLPEARREHRHFRFDREEQSRSRPSPDFDLAEVRQQLKSLEFRRRKLNTAIQEANFQHQVEFGGESIRLSEALELRKGLDTQLGSCTPNWWRRRISGSSTRRTGTSSRTTSAPTPSAVPHSKRPGCPFAP